jgi:hypothetical protein
VLSDKGFAPKDTQRRCGPMELPQSTAKVGPDPPWWGVICPSALHSNGGR